VQNDKLWSSLTKFGSMINKNYERKINLIIIDSRPRQYSRFFVKSLISAVCGTVKVLCYNIWIFHTVTERFVEVCNQRTI